MSSSLKNVILRSHESCVITGPPGCGKTGLLLELFIDQLTVNRIPPEQILFISCKPAQVSDLKQIITDRAQFSSGYTRLNVKTFWDIARDIVNNNAATAGIAGVDIPCASYRHSRFFMVRELIADTGLPGRFDQWKSNDRFIESVADALAWCDNMALNLYNLCQFGQLNWLEVILDRYHTFCTDHGVYFRENLLIAADDILHTLPADQLMTEGISLLIVDDCQNINSIQYRLLRTMYDVISKKHGAPKLVLAGNPLFALNAFGGCSTEFLQWLVEGFAIPASHHIKLSISEKIGHRIQQAINTLRPSTYGKGTADTVDDLFAGSDSRVRCITTNTQLDETYYIAHEVKNRIREGADPSDIGVLVANLDDDGRFMESVFTAMGIPVAIDRGVKLERTVAGRLMLSCLAAIGSLDDDTAVKRVIESPVFGIQPEQLNYLIERSRSDGIPLYWGAIRFADAISNHMKRTSMVDILFLLRSVTANSSDMTGIIRKIGEVSGLYSYLKTCADVEQQALRVIFDAVKYIEDFYPRCTGKQCTLGVLAEHPDYVFPAHVREKRSQKPGAVQVVSIFNCDAYSFDTVYIPGVHAQRFADLGETPLPALLRESGMKIPGTQFLHQHDRDILVNAMARARSEVILLAAVENGEPSALFDLIRNMDTVESFDAGRVFERYDQISQVHTPNDAKIWAQLKIAGAARYQRDDVTACVTGFFPDTTLPEDGALVAVNDAVRLPADFMFSPTNIDSYLECPRKFFVENLLNIRSDEYIEYMVFGNLMHTILELFHCMYPDWTSPTNEQFIQRGRILRAIMDQQITRLRGISVSMRRIISFQAQTCLQSYMNLLQKERTSIISVEKKVRFYFEKIPFSIKIDRVDTGADNSGYRIIDYKTKKNGRGPRSLKNDFLPDGRKSGPSSFQLPIYYFAVRQVFNIEPSEIGIFFLNSRDKEDMPVCQASVLRIEDGKPSFTVSVDELESVREAIVGCVGEIRRGRFERNLRRCYDCQCKFVCSDSQEGDDE